MNISSTTALIYALGAILMVAAMMIGVGYGIKFFIKLKAISGGRHAGAVTLSELFLVLLAAGALIYFPSTVVALLETVFGSGDIEESPLTWTTSGSGSGGDTGAQFAGMISAFFKLCGAFSVFSAVKSIPKLSKDVNAQNGVTLGGILIKAVAGAALLRPAETATLFGTYIRPLTSFATWLSTNGAG